MIYTFNCTACGQVQLVQAPSPENQSPCSECGGRLERDLLADLRTVRIDTTMCRDHDDVPVQHRVASNDGKRVSPAKREQAYHQAIQQRRRDLRDGNKGSFKQTHMIPAELYHGKIAETRDKNYWKDQKNLRKHNSSKVV